MPFSTWKSKHKVGATCILDNYQGDWVFLLAVHLKGRAVKYEYWFQGWVNRGLNKISPRAGLFEFRWFK